ncbi:MAG: sugar ABC transporter permease [Firmicutes bacterium]|nr:sugar ABC transporter permease [Bacillota bacterium]
MDLKEELVTLRQRTPKAPSRYFRTQSMNQHQIDLVLGILLVIPLLAVIFGVVGVPFTKAVYTSFTNKRIGMGETFVGLQNYIEIFRDGLFWIGIKNSFIYAFDSVVLKLVFGFCLALVLNEKLPLRNLWRAIILIPWAVPNLVATLTWRWMYSDTNGIINALLLKAGIIDYPIPWLASTSTAMFAVIVINVWKGIPFFTFSLLGGLQGIDAQLYEAAAIDGANWWQQIRHVVIPSLSGIIIISSLLSTIWTFNDFQTIYIATGGGPAHATTIIPTLTYERAFWNLEIGKGIAISTAAAPLFIGLIMLATRYFLRRDE